MKQIFEVLINDKLEQLIPDFELKPIENKEVLSLLNDFESGSWRFHHFHRYIWNNIAQAALNYEEREALIGEPQTTLYNAAQKLRLTDAIDSSSEGSEIAEILLYALLKDHFKALPVVAKIFYKQNVKDYAKGADSVHIVIEDKEMQVFSVWLGEAKFYNSFDNNRLAKIVESVGETLSREKLRKEFSIICGITDLRDFFGDENKLLFEKIKQKLDENTSLDEIKPILHIPILLLYECPITAETTKMDDVYRENIKKLQTDIAKQYFSKQIKKLASIIYDYQHIKFHFILFPVPDKDRIAKKFIRDAQYYRGED